MSGLFTPIESMPEWAQWFNKNNSELFYALTAYAILILILAVNRYKKVKA